MPVSVYVSYDGLLEPLGQTQVLPYLRGLARFGIRFVLLTFEKKDDLRRSQEVAWLREELAEIGIRWVALRYHKSPSFPATLWDVVRGAVLAVWWTRREKARIVHCRSYVAGAMGLPARFVCRASLIFDMRGFWPEERVEGGVWGRSSRLFHLAKRVERVLFKASDAVIVLTERARATLAEAPYADSISCEVPVEVIPCCVDPRRFARSNFYESDHGADRERILVYAGSIGTWYMLDEMLDFFGTVGNLQPELRFLILSRSEKDTIERAAGARGLGRVEVAGTPPSGVPDYMSRAYAGIYFIRPSFSKCGASPTKLGEYLAAGLPVIVNAGVGDADTLVGAFRVGVIVKKFSPEEYRAKWRELEDLTAYDGGLRARCRETARRELGLEVGLSRYRQVYEGLLAGRKGRIGVDGEGMACNDPRNAKQRWK